MHPCTEDHVLLCPFNTAQQQQQHHYYDVEIAGFVPDFVVGDIPKSYKNVFYRTCAHYLHQCSTLIYFYIYIIKPGATQRVSHGHPHKKIK